MDAYRSLAEIAALTSIGVTPGKLGRIQDGRGLRLRVETGSVWITHDRCRDDVCLEAGESYCIRKSGMTLIQTLEAPFALVTVEPAMPVKRTASERFWRFWQGLYAPAARPTTAAL